MTIRPFQFSDSDALREITVACFGATSSIDYGIEQLLGPVGGKDWAWRKARHIDADIAANAHGIFVAEADGEIIGYVTTRVDRDTKTGSIPNIAVMPGNQGRGTGRALIDAAVEYLREEGMDLVRIETLATNPIGQYLYPSCGFEEVARQIHYAMRIDGE